MEITIIESSLFSNFTKLFLCMLGIKIVSKSIFWFFLVSATDKNSARRLWVRDCGLRQNYLVACDPFGQHQSITNLKKLNLEKGHL